MTRGRTMARTLLSLGLLAALALAIGACGKRGVPQAPEGQEDAYTYPRFYPGPSKGLPIFGATPAAATPESDQEKARKKKRRSKALDEKKEQRRRLFREELELAPFSEDDNTFGTYETSPQ